jgi:hypothetical protein
MSRTLERDGAPVHEPDPYDADFFGTGEPIGFRGGQYETPPSQWPGDVPLDDEDDDVTLARLITDEWHRLKPLVGETDKVHVARDQWASEDANGFTFTDRICVSIHRNSAAIGLANASTADVLRSPKALTEAGERALTDFWSAVAAAGETGVAA